MAAGSAGDKLSEEPEDDEHGNAERLGAERNTSERPLLRPCSSQGVFRAARSHPKHELKAGGQLVLQAASSAKSPKTMNTEIQRGLGQSSTPLTPNGPLQGEVDDHF